MSSTITKGTCCCNVRYYTEMYKCLYDRLKDQCNATAAAIYTTYHLTALNRLLATMDCGDISK